MKFTLVKLRILNQTNCVSRSINYAILFSRQKMSPKFNHYNYVRAFSMQTQDPIAPVNHLALNHLDRVAIHDDIGIHTYRDVLMKSTALSKKIMEFYSGSDKQERIGFLCSNNVTYVIAQWACWASGNIGNILVFSFKFSFD